MRTVNTELKEVPLDISEVFPTGVQAGREGAPATFGAPLPCTCTNQHSPFPSPSVLAAPGPGMLPFQLCVPCLILLSHFT